MMHYDDHDLHDDKELLILPRIQKWDGSQIYNLLDDIQKQFDMVSRLNMPMEVKNHYRDLFARLVKTYGH